MRQHGFTLIELLVVIAIIGLLATFALAQLNSSRDKARISKGLAQSGQILRSVGDDLLGRWDFDECSAGPAIDSSGYGNNLTLASGVTETAISPNGQGCSLTFDGTNQIAITTPSALGAQQTKSMWVYIVGAVTGNQYMIDEGLNNNWIQVFSSRLRVGTNGAGNYFDSAATVVTGKWYFIVTTYDGTKLSLYIDGSMDKSASVAAQAPTATMTIGSANGGTARLTGSLNDIRLYNRSLTSQEVHQLYADGLPRHLAEVSR